MTFRRELLRKSLHLPGLIFLFLGKAHFSFSIGLLSSLIALYLISHLLESRTGRGIPVISTLTDLLKRSEKFDVAPACLGFGILFALLFFEYRIAACAIIQVCLADVAACLAGKSLGKKKIFYSLKKTYLGSFVFLVSAFLFQLFFISPAHSFVLALVGSLLESLPFGEWDNLIIPLGAALTAYWMGV